MNMSSDEYDQNKSVTLCALSDILIVNTFLPSSKLDELYFPESPFMELYGKLMVVTHSLSTSYFLEDKKKKVSNIISRIEGIIRIINFDMS